MGTRLNYLKGHANRFRSAGIPMPLERQRGTVSIKPERKHLLDDAGFKRFQQTPTGLLIPAHDPAGQVRLHQYRHNHPGGRPKYETPKARICLDVHPAALEAVLSPDQTLYITEGPLKGDALVARGLATLDVLGAWMWRRAGRPLKDWDLIPLEDREVVLLPDSDVATNEGVHSAFRLLELELMQRGARIECKEIPRLPCGRKQGIDDWLGAHGTAESIQTLKTFDLTRIGPKNPETKSRRLVAEQIERTAVREAAEEYRAVASFEPPRSRPTLVEELAIQEPALEYAIEGWQFEGHNVTLAAEYKAGKTSLLLHAMKCRCDDLPFLGKHATHLIDIHRYGRSSRCPCRTRTRRGERPATAHVRGEAASAAHV